jgi:chromosome segregation ATPase
VPEGAPAADVLGRCFAKLPRDRPTAKQLAEAFTLAAVPAPSPVLDQREHEQTLQLAQRMVEQEAITEEVTRVNSRLTQEISQLKQENVRELTALKQQISAGEEELASKVRELDTERERAMAAETSMEVLEGKLQALTREASAVSEELARKEKELSRMRDAQSELESREAMLREEKNALQEELGNKFSKGHYIATFCSINITGR